MPKRKRDTTARSRIRAYLAEHGPVREETGGATTALREAVDYQGSAVAFIQLITAMDEAGEIVREIRGKRTYTISAAQAGQEHATPPAQGPAKALAPIDIDYRELASALLRELGRVLAAGHADNTAVGEQQRSLVAERDRLKAERDEYAARLESSRRHLNALVALYVRNDSDDQDDAADDALRATLAQLRGAEHPDSVGRDSVGRAS